MLLFIARLFICTAIAMASLACYIWHASVEMEPGASDYFRCYYTLFWTIICTGMLYLPGVGIGFFISRRTWWRIVLAICLGALLALCVVGCDGHVEILAWALLGIIAGYHGKPFSALRRHIPPAPHEAGQGGADKKCFATKNRLEKKTELR